ncbi:hypothetical protein [Salipaludibacillus agaradhaerens]|uniref:hypothetical protein n=1 Tax=Salipaludibacillus agaradhaerens TaxID=76935 RepID=UPI002150C657|nr:hypothetical protein [Salipaludibacillus agaradhaerens]
MMLQLRDFHLLAEGWRMGRGNFTGSIINLVLGVAVSDGVGASKRPNKWPHLAI